MDLTLDLQFDDRYRLVAGTRGRMQADQLDALTLDTRLITQDSHQILIKDVLLFVGQRLESLENRTQAFVWQLDPKRLESGLQSRPA